MRIGPYQAVGLVGVALFATGAALAVVLPQLSPPVHAPGILTWALTGIGAVLFWIGVFGGIGEVLAGPGRSSPASRSEGPRPR